MRGFNRAIIMGNVARDPEIRYTATQKAVASFSVAVNRSWKDANGELREEVNFIPVVVWGKAAETCERYMKKGAGVLVEGRINTRSYESKTGEKRYVTEIVADNFQFVGPSWGRELQERIIHLSAKERKFFLRAHSPFYNRKRKEIFSFIKNPSSFEKTDFYTVSFCPRRPRGQRSAPARRGSLPRYRRRGCSWQSGCPSGDRTEPPWAI